MENREKIFRAICDRQFEVYKEKNHDYGDSFVYGMDKMGRITFATRMMDKQQRVESLVLKELQGQGHKVKDETFDDTVRDMFNYCLMYLMWKEEYSTKTDAVDHFSNLQDEKLKEYCAKELNKMVGRSE